MASKRIDRSALTELIRSIDGISNEQRADLLQLLKEQKRYGLVWEEHSEDVEEQLRENLPVLKEVCERRILSDDAESPNHILIEGDNLHALTALTYTHEGKVDVIYIDPPYNTGNKDFIYNDSFVDAEDGFRHSKWLSFMNKRLRMAKRLLSERGVIFISIDDNEQANLKLLCDEVFGEKNFQGHIHWRRRHNQPNDKTKMIGLVTEHILVYAKNYEVLKENGVGKIPITATFSNPDNDPKGPWASKPWKTGSDQTGTRYTIISPQGKVFDEEWMGDFDTYNKYFSEGRIYFTNNGKGLPRKKYYKSEREEEGQCATNWWSHEMFGHNQGANDLLTSIFGKKNIFSNPKPIELLKGIINVSLKDNQSSIILDFFAGSGTTLHATMQLNEEDGGKRQCILVTNNENNICEEVTYERNKRVIEGYTTPKGEQVEGLKNNNLRYYKIDFVDRDSSVTAMKKLMVASTDLLCIKQNLYEEKDTFGSIILKPNIARYFNDGVKQMLIIYNTDAIESLVAEIEKMPEDTNIITYVFSTNNYPLNADFEDVADKVSLCALPAAINNAYRNVLPNKLTPKSDDHETETISGE